MAKIRFRTDTLTLDRTVTFPDADVDFTAYIDERSQDAIGSILTDSSTINFIYDDGVPSITAEVLDSPLLGGDLPSFYLDRTNHTGTQLAATISDFDTAVETVGDARYVELTGDTMTGSLAITVTGSLAYLPMSSSSSSSIIFLDSAVGSSAQLVLGNGGTSRWEFDKTNTAEPGANAGSNLRIRASSDTGTLIDFPISIVRAAGGAITLSRPLETPQNIYINTTASVLTPTGKAIVVDGSTEATPIGRLVLRGSRTTNNNFGVIDFSNSANDPTITVAQLTSYRDGANDAAGINFVTKATGLAAAVRSSINSIGQFNNNDGTAALPAYSFTNDPDCGLYRISANNLGVSTAGTLNSVFTGTNNLLLGGITTELNSAFRLQIASGAGNGSVWTTRFGANASGDVWVGSKSRSGTVGTPGTIVVNGDDLLNIRAQGDDGVDLSTQGGAIVFEVAGTPAANRIPTRIDFQTAEGLADDDISTKVRITPQGYIHAGSGSSANPVYSFLADNDTGISSPNPNEIDFATAGVSRVVFDIYGGIFAFNNNRPTTVDGSQHALVVNQSAQANAVFRKSVGNANAATLEFVKSRGSIASPTVILDGDSIGVMRFEGYNNAGAYVESAAITARVEGTVAATVPGILVFRTTPAGGSSTERMTIQPNGEVIVGTAGAGPYGAVDSAVTPVFQVNTNNADNADRSVLISHFSATAAAGPILEFGKSSSSTLGTFTATASGSTLGSLGFSGADGTDFSRGASIFAITTALATAGDVPADLGFSTKADGLPLSEKFRITGDGRLYGTALHNNSGSVTGTTNQYIASGTYTPTLTNSTNVAASTAFVCQWLRVGNVVTVSGQVNIDVTTANVESLLGMSLPIASAFTTPNQCGGTGALVGNTTERTVAIRGDATNDRAEFHLRPAVNTNIACHFSFTYLIV